MLKYNLNKKAQSASTITWIAATLIIVLILTIFYFASSVFVVRYSLKGDIEDETSLNTNKNSFLDIKTSIAFLLTSENDRPEIKRFLEKKGIDLGEYLT